MNPRLIIDELLVIVEDAGPMKIIVQAVEPASAGFFLRRKGPLVAESGHPETNWVR
jgi:hypothetical protein